MPGRDLTALPNGGLNHGPGLLALAVSLGLHGAALAGLLLLHQATPPAPLPAIAVELLSAGEAAALPGPESNPQEKPSATMEDLSRLDHVAGTAPQANGTGAVQAAKASDQSTTIPGPDTPPAHRAVPEGGESLRAAASDPGSNRSSSTDAFSAFAERSVTSPPAPRRKPRNPAQSSDRSIADSATPIDTGREMQRPKQIAYRETAAIGPRDATIATPSIEADVRGGDGSASRPDAQPKYSGGGLSNAPPRYPFVARRRGQEGRVVLLVQVSATGDAVAVRLRESSGHRLLDEAALEAIKSWRFVPASRAGRPVAGSVAVPISFRLDD